MFASQLYTTATPATSTDSVRSSTSIMYAEAGSVISYGVATSLSPVTISYPMPMTVYTVVAQTVTLPTLVGQVVWSATGLPSGVTLNSANGALTIAKNTVFSTQTIMLAVTDTATSNTVQLPAMLIATNVLPTQIGVTTSAAFSTPSLATFLTNATPSSVTPATQNWALSSPPAGVTIGSTTGILTFAQGTTFSGSLTVTLTGSATATITVPCSVVSVTAPETSRAWLVDEGVLALDLKRYIVGSSVVVQPTPSPFWSGPLASTGYLNMPGTVGNYISIPSTTGLGFQWWAQDFTIEAWVYYTALPVLDGNNVPALIGNMSPAGSQNYWSFGMDSSLRPFFYYWNGTTNRITWSGAGAQLNTWNHIAMTYTTTGSTIRTFLNGVAVASASLVGTPQILTTVPIAIGSLNNLLDVVRIASIRMIKGYAAYTDSFTAPTTLTASTTGTTMLLLSVETTLPDTQYLGANSYTVDLRSVFSSSTASFTFAVAPTAYQGAVTLVNTVLTVKGNYRNTKYVVSVTAANPDGTKTTQAFTVYETVPPITVPPGCQGLFSLYAVNAAYLGPVVQCRRSSDSAGTTTADFYCVNGQLVCTDAKFGNGTTPISVWLGAGITAYVTKWYDQSGANNHASMATVASQPTVNATPGNMRVAFATSQYLNMPDGTIPYGNSAYTMSAKVTLNNSTAYCGIVGSGTYDSATLTGLTNALAWFSDKYLNYWWSNDFGGGTYSAGNVVTCKYDQTTRTMYVNGASVASEVPATARASTSINNTIGRHIRTGDPYWLNGDLNYVAIFADSLGDQSRLSIEGLLSTTATSPVLSYDASTVSSVSSSASWTNYMLGTYPATACRALFSLYVLNAAYSGPIANCRRSTDNVTADFYSLNGQLYTNNGTTGIASWLGGATAYVTKWYDQSGSGNHATMATTSKQPSVSVANMRVAFASSQYLSMPDGTVPFGDTQYTITAKHTLNNTAEYCGIVGSGSYNSVGVGDTNALCWYGNVYGYLNYWMNNDISGGTYTAGNVVTCKYDGTTRTIYVNGTSVSTLGSSGRASTSINNTIGVTQSGTFWLNGDLTFVAIFAESLSDQSRLAVEGLLTASAAVANPVLLNYYATLPNYPVASGDNAMVASWPNSGLLGAYTATAPGNMPTVGSVSSSSAVVYPPFAMTANTCTPGGIGSGATYAASASSASDAAYLAFDYATGTQWTSASGVYATSTGAYAGTASTTDSVTGRAYLGEWLQFRMPYSVACASYSFRTHATDAARCPSAWALLGSGDGVAWTLISSKAATTSAASSTTVCSVASKSAYSYFRIVITALNKVGSGSGWVSLSEFNVTAPQTRLSHTNFVSASTQYLSIQSLPLTWFNNSGVYSGGMTVFVVAQFTGSNNWEHVFDFGNGPDSGNILFGRQSTNSSTDFSILNQATRSIPSHGSPFPADGAFHIFVCKVANSSAPTCIDYLDGVTSAVGTYSSLIPIENRTTTLNYIGKSNWSSDASLGANVRQIVIFNSALSQPDLARAYQSIASSWGMFNDGSIPSQAGTNASAIKTLTNTNVDGGYWIAGNAGPVLAYCIMRTSLLTACYSVRAIVSGYTGPVVNVRRSSDNATCDFYTDGAQSSGELLTSTTYPPNLNTTIVANALSYTVNGYVVSCSSIAHDGVQSINAFISPPTGSRWTPTTSKYTAGATANAPYIGSVVTTDNTSTQYLGEWIQLKLPTAIVVTSCTMTPFTANKVYILGSSDGSSWTLIASPPELKGSQGYVTSAPVSITGAAPYSYYRWVIGSAWNTNANGTSGFFNISITGTPMTLTNWLGSSSAYITKWYDQSVSANHATNSTSATQPMLVRHCGYWVVRWLTASSTVLNLTNSIQPNTVVSHFLNTNGLGTIVTTQFDYGLRLGDTTVGSVNGWSGASDWYFSSGGTKLAYVNGVSTNSIKYSSWTCMAVSSSSPTWTIYSTACSFNRIGTDGNSATRSINGYMTEMYFHNKALQVPDMAPINANRFPIKNNASFPPGPMTAASTTFSASANGAAWTTDGGTYVATASSSAAGTSTKPWVAFNPGSGAAGGWTPSTSSYTGTGGLYVGSTTTSTYSGEWIQLTSNEPLFLTSYSITVSLTAQAPIDFVLLGSTDGGTTWTLLDTRSGESFTAGVAKQYTPNQTIWASYSILRLVCSKSASSALSIFGLRFYGVPETPLPQALSVQNLILYLDAASTTSYSGSGSLTWTDLSASNNSFTLTNCGYNASPASISFNGTSSFARSATLSTAINYSSCTFIFWVQILGTNYDGRVLCQYGRNSTDHDTEFLMYVNAFNDWDSSSPPYGVVTGFDTVTDMLISKVSTPGWYQIAFVKNGTSGTYYLNGMSNGTVTAGKNATYSNNDFCIGKDYSDNNSFLTGNVGVVMVYNSSLSASDILANFNFFRSRYF